MQLGHVGLDPSRVFHARDVSLDRAGFHISLDDGVIAFTASVAGRVTGALFEGDGEILLTPPNQAERASMMLQTGAAILEERFSGAYFRFNDDTYEQLRPSLNPADNAQEFVAQWNQTALNLAEPDALRLFVTFSESLPVTGRGTQAPPVSRDSDDRFLHGRMQGRAKGSFDVFFDSNAPEQVWAGQLKIGANSTFYNVWTSYSLLKKKTDADAATTISAEEGRASAIDISHFKIRTAVTPPTTIDAEAELRINVKKGGQRTFLFELARALVVKQVEADGQAVEFIHNPALEGTQLARRGNDLVAVVLPQPVRTGQVVQLRFVYKGEVLAEAGPGLLYVGARGTWYPNRGLAMANFDLEFRYPPGWTLVATGKRVEEAPTAGDEAAEQVSRWVSERPIPVAGFNLGKYQKVEVRAGNVTVEAYATKAMERGFPTAPAAVVRDPASAAPLIVVPPPPPPSPARNAQKVADASARAIDQFSRRYGPYPYSQLALTQMPGSMSQGWPGLIFLSGISFLTEDEESQLHVSPEAKAQISIVIGHETAHQWWGDLVMWSDYRDQWLFEALANYSSLMLIEDEDPSRFHTLLEKYRDDLLENNPDGVPLMQDGPVTLGTRLSCSQFPNGYEAISYGRGTWLLHMLRYMMLDAEPKGARPASSSADSTDEPFVRALRRVRNLYQGKPVTTRQFLRVFEEELPRSLWYEGRQSLDWFYRGWVEGTSIPRYELKNVKYLDGPTSTAVTGVLVQNDAPNDLVTAVPLDAAREGATVMLKSVFADGPETPFHLIAPRGTRKVVIDPNHTLLRRSH